MTAADPLTRYYDADFADVSDDLPFYRELARRTGGPILEAMCGSGRVLLPLARGGYALTGVDLSAGMLALARQRLEAAGFLKRVTLLEGDVRTALPSGEFALAIVALNSLMHLLNIAEQLAALQHLHGALRPGGILALDLFNPHTHQLAEQQGTLAFDKTFHLPDGTLVQKFVAQQTDMAAQINRVTFLYDEIAADGLVRRATLPFAMRWLYRFELEHLLARVGFELEAVYGSYELDPYTNDSDLMLTVARRR